MVPSRLPTRVEREKDGAVGLFVLYRPRVKKVHTQSTPLATETYIIALEWVAPAGLFLLFYDIIILVVPAGTIQLFRNKCQGFCHIQTFVNSNRATRSQPSSVRGVSAEFVADECAKRVLWFRSDVFMRASKSSNSYNTTRHYSRQLEDPGSVFDVLVGRTLSVCSSTTTHTSRPR